MNDRVEGKKYVKKKRNNIKGLELVAYAGEARSLIMECINNAKNNDFEKIDELMKEAEELLNQAHRSQADMLFEEAKEEYNEITLTIIHGQDHLMTTLLLKDLAYNLIEFWKKQKKWLELF
ncbi:PTS lactose/cellobiose transporter subunit IIA [Spiroplasma taiwanense]|uniref:PTS system lactose-specific EIIA component n=1 Tax=Spiroplasma taiwanense CT-1 TaxID=1276220 RepID=S5M038_9MOLU|nr:PTS lactose/cellobiose transporter subunit IIA [Spiroplasma taiwanense]AGR41367.1 PTS system cellobiose-specific IIA component [Spiroplasma taiwanense CT-1]